MPHRRRRRRTAEPAAGARRKPCCVAEDEDGVRQLAVESLERRGYRVLAAASGEEALKLAGAYDGTIHLLLSDVVMPGMKGPELADRLRAHAARHPGAADVRLRRRRRDARRSQGSDAAVEAVLAGRARQGGPADPRRAAFLGARFAGIIPPSPACGLADGHRVRSRRFDDSCIDSSCIGRRRGAAGRGRAPQAVPEESRVAHRDRRPPPTRCRLDTSAGPVVIQVTRAWAPLGADRFYNLVKNGFYDDVRFFRVIPGFMAQGGMNGDPAIQKLWGRANFNDDPVKQSNKRGFVTFAKTGAPNSRSTQFFINYGDNARPRRGGLRAVRPGDLGHGGRRQVRGLQERARIRA